ALEFEDRFGDRTPQAFGGAMGVFDRDVTEQNDELFSAVTGQEILGTKRAEERGSEALEHQISSRVPVSVVDVFEVIDIENQDRHVSSMPLRVRKLGIESIL